MGMPNVEALKGAFLPCPLLAGFVSFWPLWAGVMPFWPWFLNLYEALIFFLVNKLSHNNILIPCFNRMGLRFN